MPCYAIVGRRGADRRFDAHPPILAGRARRDREAAPNPRLRPHFRCALSNVGESLAVVALEAGCSDQAHLGREIPALCRMTAGGLARPLTR
jgi:hypothetical protein